MTKLMRFARNFFLFAISFSYLIYFTTIFWSSRKNLHIASKPIKKLCEIPKLNPWDLSLLAYWEPKNPLMCSKLQPELLYLDNNQYLQFNQSELIVYNYPYANCRFRCFHRAENNDWETNVGDWSEFKSAEKIDCEFLETACVMHETPVFDTLHAQIVVNKSRISEIKHMQDDSPSVLLFVLDSVSHSEFIRTLPKTLSFLKQELDAIVFDGYTKVGDNSLPNAAAFLTGKRVDVKGQSWEIDWTGDWDNMSTYTFDHWPLIWKDFHRKGYVTYFAEDGRNMYHMFKFAAAGFTRTPTDHYLQPYWSRVHETELQENSDRYCYGQFKKHMVQLNYLQQFMEKYKPYSKFALNWFSELGHESGNDPAIADLDFMKFFKSLKPSLENTVLFVLSDHGVRMDMIGLTPLGKIEVRLPFFSVILPPWMRRKFPEIQQNLQENAAALTSAFDLHVTMHDILLRGRNFPKLNQQLDWAKMGLKRGLSIFRPIPDRDCKNASIPNDFCVCRREKSLSVDLPEVQLAAKNLIEHVNSLLQTYPNCKVLSLRTIINSQLVTHHDSENTADDGTIAQDTVPDETLTMRVTVSADPSGAVFDAILKGPAAIPIYSSGEHVMYTVDGEVNRLNKYGSQSACVKSKLAKKYCYCK